MKKALKRIEMKVWSVKDGKQIAGVHSGITGDASDIRGNVSDITGNVSGITGNVSGIRGNVSYIRGNLDDCEITKAERKKGIDIKELIQEA